MLQPSYQTVQPRPSIERYWRLKGQDILSPDDLWFIGTLRRISHEDPFGYAEFMFENAMKLVDEKHNLTRKNLLYG